MEQEFKETMLLQEPHIIRRKTAREDLEYYVMYSPAPDLVGYATTKIGEILS